MPRTYTDIHDLTTRKALKELAGGVATHTHGGASGGGIDHTTLTNIGVNTHAVVDTHLASTANPHTVTAAQAGAPTLAALASTTHPTEGSTLIGTLSGHNLHDTLEHIMNRSALSGMVTTATGGLNIAWTAGELYCIVCLDKVDITSGSGACTDDSINYLVWEGEPATTLVIRATPATGNETNIAVIACQSGAVLTINQDLYMHEIGAAVKRSLNRMFPVIVTDGLVVSEDTDATNVWDVACSAGVFYIMGTLAKIEAAPILSRTTAMRRWYHVAGAWTSDTNAQIDTTQYDNLTALAAVTANKYYKSLFMIMGGVIQWVYPQAEYDTESQAIAAPLPTIPAGLALHPQLTAVVLRGNAAAFPTAGDQQWIDVRPRLGGNVSSTITDHGSLAGLTDDDHGQYALDAGTSVADNFVGFTNTDGRTLKDSGSKAADFAAAAKGVTNGDSHDHVGGDGAQIDHGGLAGLADNDHTQYVRHALATSENSILMGVASPFGAWEEERLVGLQALLGLGGYTVTLAGTTACRGQYLYYGQNDGVDNFKHRTESYYLTRRVADHTWYIAETPAALLASTFIYIGGGGATPTLGTYTASIGSTPDAVVSVFVPAPIERSVTNGDTHDHVGGDGAQIAHTGLSSIGTNTHFSIDSSLGTLDSAISNMLSATTAFTNIKLTAGGDIRPSANSTTAISIAQADGTDFVAFDTTNKWVSVGADTAQITAPAYALHVRNSAAWNATASIASFGNSNDDGHLVIGVASAGGSMDPYIQSRYSRGDATVYPLLINPYGGNIAIGAAVAPTAMVDISSDVLRLRTAKTPASAGAAGNAGDICWDANYVYVCTATNTWKRSAIATW